MLLGFSQQSREQYRLSGRVRIITASEKDETLLTARQEQWKALTDNARIQVRVCVAELITGSSLLVSVLSLLSGSALQHSVFVHLPCPSDSY